jgi:radical SAM protein with 4Fe4S-binding SPASM domain
VLTNLSDPIWRKGLASVMEGIGRYGIQKPFTGSTPFLVVWNITRACNLACKHCYEDAHTIGPDELTPQQRLRAVDRMADAGIAYIAISGGEPLILPDFPEVAKRIIDNEMGFSIATNATLLTKEKAKMLKQLDCKFIQVSLDGANAKTHNAFRGRNAFQKTIRGIKNAVAEDIFVGISATVTKYNYKEVPAIIDLSEKLGAKVFMHYNFIPTGRGREIVNMDITPQEREALLEMLASQAGKRKISLLSTAPQYSRVCLAVSSSAVSLTHFDTIGQTQDADAIRFFADFIGGCGTGRLYCAVEPNGDIEPCVFIPIKIGNIMKDDIQKLWHNSEVLTQLREREHFKGHCGVCENRNVCGGCRARAYGYYHDLSACDPGCMNNLEAWDELKGMKTEVKVRTR